MRKKNGNEELNSLPNIVPVILVFSILAMVATSKTHPDANHPPANGPTGGIEINIPVP